MARKATAQDVADLAGVSRSAVSLVLNGRAQGHIARHKQQAIIEAARRLNYTPNAVALSLRSRRTPHHRGTDLARRRRLLGAHVACDAGERDGLGLSVDLHGYRQRS